MSSLQRRLKKYVESGNGQLPHSNCQNTLPIRTTNLCRSQLGSSSWLDGAKRAKSHISIAHIKQSIGSIIIYMYIIPIVDTVKQSDPPSKKVSWKILNLQMALPLYRLRLTTKGYNQSSPSGGFVHDTSTHNHTHSIRPPSIPCKSHEIL